MVREALCGLMQNILKKKTGPPLNWRVAPVWVERGEKEEGQQLTLGKGHQM